MKPTADDPRFVTVRNAGGDAAVVSLHGGQVLSWRTAAEGEHLYCSPWCQAAAGKAVRGGIPVCFPQFAARGALPKHGFARNIPWERLPPCGPTTEVAPDVAEARFLLGDSSETRAIWNQSFLLELAVKLGPGWLELTLGATNTGHTAWDFTGALHTYLGVEDVRTVELVGLANGRYEDALQDNAVSIASAAKGLRFSGELDRVYFDTPSNLLLPQASGKGGLHITQQGFPDTVVWNPGPVKALALGDMPATDWLHMLCVEAACVGVPVWLEPGQSWQGCQRLTVRQSFE